MLAKIFGAHKLKFFAEDKKILKQVQDDTLTKLTVCEGNNIKKAAFTLAEVLITLGIIGVVAAMTIPNLMTKIQTHEIEARVKKSYATMANAMRLSSIDNGEPETWPTGEDMDVDLYWKTYLQPYLKSARLCANMKACGYKSNYQTQEERIQWSGLSWTLITESSRILFQLFDGTVVFIPRNDATNSYVSNFYIDVNGPKAPNTFCKDVFIFKRGTSEGITPILCTLKLRENGWKFPKDYNY